MFAWSQPLYILFYKARLNIVSHDRFQENYSCSHDKFFTWDYHWLCFEVYVEILPFVIQRDREGAGF
jgi:hypothetical protein